MGHICKRCKRTNPREAVYCYHDGALLGDKVGGDIPADGGAINLGARPFTVPCVLPSGKACYNFQQLAEACHQAPTDALDLLREGHLESFLAGQGRTDLARAAKAAARADDKERGLDDFLGRLPFSLPSARLRVEPAALDLGTLRIDEDRRLELVLRNEGMRLLYGSAVCDAPWLSFGDGPAQGSKLFQFSSRAVLPVHILGRNLRAFHKPQECKIRLESSGGAVTVGIRLQVPVKPFSEGVLVGALSPRELAKKAKEAVKEAAVLIESGAVARWYQANGWTYPVLGRSASGVAAVQQLFEALGLVKPPLVELSEEAIRLDGRPGEKLEYTLAVITQENRPAIAHGDSDQPWLQVGRTIFRGRSAFLPLTIASVPARPGETLTAVVSVAANGGQRFAVPVALAIGGPGPTAPAPGPARQEAVRPPVAQLAPAPVAAMVPVPAPMAILVTAPPPAPSPASQEAVRAPVPQLASAPTAVSSGAAPPGRRAWLILLPALLLGAVAMGGVLRDLLAPAHQMTEPIDDQRLDSTPRLQIRYHETTRNDVMDTLFLPDHQATMRFGLVMLHKGKKVGKGVNLLRLTFDPWGRTNNTCLRFDQNDERLFGSGGKGHWQESGARDWKDEQGREHDGVRSVWVWDDKKVAATQFVELVQGQQSGLLDTCRVRYVIENRDVRPHAIGIRFLLDTFIGGNDGVPFTIPGEPDLCNTMKDLPSLDRDGKIPDFLQALEKPDLARPGTIAHLRLKLETLEPPARVTIGAWPNEKLRVLDKKAAGPLTLWNVPLAPLKSLGLDDSAITIYWKEQPLEPKAKREVGFEYGLWELASQSSRLATIVDGAFRPDGELTVVAYVNRSGQDQVKDESVALKLPDGFKLLEGAETQQVPRRPKDAKSPYVPITWRVQAGTTGSYEFHVTTSSGLAQTLKVEIRKSIY
jgi:hypothetical protein